MEGGQRGSDWSLLDVLAVGTFSSLSSSRRCFRCHCRAVRPRGVVVSVVPSLFVVSRCWRRRHCRFRHFRRRARVLRVGRLPSEGRNTPPAQDPPRPFQFFALSRSRRFRPSIADHPAQMVRVENTLRVLNFKGFAR